ncbi:type I-E CRISPR-associated protein Cas7/Cse4/CasC [Glycomyces sp. A-F 0318]|uniref:type I-E CRISPR-associated protein Cas7/Cse4/CasC n=1 Tax=Glycomyces amatae TaxID=2881355 RepID=UPI001E63A1A9|nr:type I-E CRISPR-associated protein Cas7/Cse4/CasC [Glycomyces amatae]MCD0447510.1 type I-E CRISPR-associated protein Cas7/Cse4/CasC [Glycomyces amatae]
MARFLELHALQSIPVANLNRDDLGSPKMVTYGGVDRIRISSQAQKRPIRHGVESDLGQFAFRTRQLPNRLQSMLTGTGWTPEAAAFAWQQIADTVGKEGKQLKFEISKQTGLPITAVLLLLPDTALGELADLCQTHQSDLEREQATKKPAQVLPKTGVLDILKSRNVSISMFGRMLAEVPGANVDGAVQIAHAFTTHAAEPQRDYFTAVDDWLSGDEDAAGTGHLDTAEFSAGVFYRYGCLNLDDFLKYLGDDHEMAARAVASFADHFLMTLPQAKKNSTAPHTVPDLAYLTVRDRRPVSFAAAFETPARPARGGGIAGPSRDAFNAYAADVHRLTAGRGLCFGGHVTVGTDTYAHLNERFDSYAGLIDAAVHALMPQP